MHLTNSAINMLNDDYVHPEEDQILEENTATIRTLTSLWKSLESKKIDVNKIKQNIAQTCGRVMQMYGPLIEQSILANGGVKSVPGLPFQILGMDVLIDSQLKAWILEINTSPSMNMYFDASRNFMERNEMTEEDICPINLYVKSRIVKDTIGLAS